ncbi:transcription antitermination factor NusB [Aggregatilineales bacterium SYSU G02658]
MYDFPFQDVDFEPEDIESVEVLPHERPMTGRSLARRLALQALYEVDTTGHPVEAVIAHFLARGSDTLNIDVVVASTEGEQPTNLINLIQETRTLEDEETRILQYFQRLVFGIVQVRTVLDELLGAYAPDFPIDQVAVVDRNILRIALWEIGVDRRVPIGVAIDEAIELAKLFGSEATPRFVNGVLGTIAQNIKQVRELLRASIEEYLATQGRTLSGLLADSEPTE